MSEAARKLADGLRGKVPSLRSIMLKSQAQSDEFTRLQREVKNGRPISGLARAVFETEKARRDGESDAE